MGEYTKQRAIAVVGDSMLDVYRFGEWDGKRRVFCPRTLHLAPGGAGNVACNVKTLGATPLLFSVVGRSRLSSRYRQCLRQAGVVQDYLKPSRVKDICEKVNFMDQSHRVLRLDRDDTRVPPHAEQEALLHSLLESGTAWSDLIVSDYQKGCITSASFDRIRQFCSQRNIRLYVDSASGWNMEGVYFYKPNRFQLEKVVGQPLEGMRQLTAAALHFKRRYGIRHMAVTMDARGAVYLDEHDGVHPMESVCQDAVDPCGAGDTFLAALAVAVASGRPVARAVRIANEAAGVACRHTGTHAVAAGEVPGWND